MSQLITYAIFLALRTILVWFSWNCCVSEVFGIQYITMAQSFGLVMVGSSLTYQMQKDLFDAVGRLHAGFLTVILVTIGAVVTTIWYLGVHLVGSNVASWPL